eukprot:g1577.t1
MRRVTRVPVASRITRAKSEQMPFAMHDFESLGLPPRPFSPLAVFTIGIPGSGKTSAIHRLFGRDNVSTIIDLDTEMKNHPEYDPANPAAVYDSTECYDWANARVEEKFQNVIKETVIEQTVTRKKNPIIVLDGTGTNADRHIRRMLEARYVGNFSILLLHVHVSVDVALERNAQRTRVVPADTLKAYEERLQKALSKESKYADAVLTVNNDEDDGLSILERYGESYDTKRPLLILDY